MAARTAATTAAGQPESPAGGQQEEDDGGAEDDRHDAVGEGVGIGEIADAAQPERGQRKVVERGAVVGGGVVGVGAGLEELAGLVGLVGLIGVHGPESEAWQADRQSADCHGQNARPAKEGCAVHFAGLPYTSTSI